MVVSNRRSGRNSSYFIMEQRYLLVNENGRNDRPEMIESCMMEKWSNQGENNYTESQQLVSLKMEPVKFLRRTFSFQVGKKKELVKLDSEISAMIKLRYKDTAKHVIWRDCALPEEYSRGYLTLSSDYSKRAAIRHNHAGNHQAVVPKLRNYSAAKNDFAIVPFDSPKTFPRTKHQKQCFYAAYPTRTLPSINLTKIQKEKRVKRAASMDVMTKSSETIADIEDDQTPIPKQIINSVRRSESSDENESIVNLTAPLIEDESGFCEGNHADSDDIEPDLQIWRL